MIDPLHRSPLGQPVRTASPLKQSIQNPAPALPKDRVTVAGRRSEQSLSDVLSKAKQAQGAEQQRAIRAALTGISVPFTNSEGRTETIEVESAGRNAGKEAYRVTVGTRQFQVQLPPNLEPAEVIAPVVDYYTQVPEHLRAPLQTLTVENGGNPEDRQNAMVYQLTGFQSAATAGGKDITFWNGTRNLVEEVFNHEMAHLFGEQIENQQDSVFDKVREVFTKDGSYPDGWEQAAKADRAHVSDYAETTFDEDFAESWAAYVQAREAGQDELAAFGQEYPHREKILRQVYEDTLKK